MKITMALPHPAWRPVGGYRVVYEYADRLAAKGHELTICHSLRLPHTEYTRPYIVRYLGYHLLKNRMPTWFTFENKVDLQIVPAIADETIPDGDMLMATSWATAYAVSKLSPSKGKKFYLIQHYEVWDGDKDLVDKTYTLGLGNIVIAKWLKDTVEGLGGEVVAHIPNGMNFDLFKLKNQIEERNPLSVAIMYHTADWKGSKDGFAALEMVREKFPELSVSVFSAYPKPDWLPEWVSFTQSPPQSSLVDIYNSSAIFISPSWAEGWPLPPAESMACGCALVTTDIGGVHDYAIHEKTALLSPPKNPKALADNILRLLNDDELRITLAKSGYDHIRNFTWDNSVNKLEKTFLENS